MPWPKRESSHSTAASIGIVGGGNGLLQQSAQSGADGRELGFQLTNAVEVLELLTSAQISAQGCNAHLVIAITALILGGELAVVRQGIKLARGDAMALEAWRKQIAAMDFPAGPIWPWQITGADGQQAHCGGIGIAFGEPAPPRARGHAAERCGLGSGKATAELQVWERGQIGREALREEIAKIVLRPIVAGLGGQLSALADVA